MEIKTVKQKGQESRMRKWMKYIAVVCCFLLMAVSFVPDSGSKVIALEAGEGQNESQPESQNEGQNESQPESQNEGQPEVQSGEQIVGQSEELIEEQSTTGNLIVKWSSEGNSWGNPITVSGTQNGSDSDYTYSITFPTDAPTKNGATFAGWKCNDSSISDQTYQNEATVSLVCSSNITEITFTAQWTENNFIAVSFVIGEGATWVDSSNNQVTQDWSVAPGSGNIYYINIPADIPQKANSEFKGWEYVATNIESVNSGTATGGQEIKIDGTQVSTGATITFTAKWLEISVPADNKISANGAYQLSQGIQYTLDAGKWKVDVDSNTIYGNDSGVTFYASPGGTYTFTQQ